MMLTVVQSVGYGMAVDIWAVGVFTYFLMSGIIPFERESQKLYVDAIMAANYKFEPENIWNKVSEDAKDFIGECLIVDPTNRPTAEAALRHKWLNRPDGDRAATPRTDLYPLVAGAFGKTLNSKIVQPSITHDSHKHNAGEAPHFSVHAMTMAPRPGMSVAVHRNPFDGANELMKVFRGYMNETEAEVPKDAVLAENHDVPDIERVAVNKVVRVERK
ncbi:hypothetical protein HWV62_1252 [Athelia sp. TMB]|nr:hypothetical protein HWV62_1252 [Athelia sp. TMB]